MRANEPAITLPDDMDPECVALCNALNSLPGITTTSSCCGHGERPYWIFFVADSLEALPEVCYCVARCHSGEPGWQVTVNTDCSMAPAWFMLEGPVGAFAAAERIAAYVTRQAGDADE